MKSRITVFLLAVVFLLASCASLKTYNPENIPEEEMVILDIYDYIEVFAMDGITVDWGHWFFARKQVKIPSGLHTFLVYYSDGRQRSLPSPITGFLKKGNTYTIRSQKHRIDRKDMISFSILLYNNWKIGNDITINNAIIQEHNSGMISDYLKYVKNPAMNETGNSVKLENDQHILIFMPDYVYAITDKNTGETIIGRAEFKQFSHLTVHETLFDIDISEMSSDLFLNNSYAMKPMITLVPVECSETEVTYLYQDPAELRGNRVTFSITEIKRDR